MFVCFPQRKPGEQHFKINCLHKARVFGPEVYLHSSLDPSSADATQRKLFCWVAKQTDPNWASPRATGDGIGRGPLDGHSPLILDANKNQLRPTLRVKVGDPPFWGGFALSPPKREPRNTALGTDGFRDEEAHLRFGGGCGPKGMDPRWGLGWKNLEAPFALWAVPMSARSLSPVVPLDPFLGGGFPFHNRPQKRKGTLEDLVVVSR